MKRLHVVAFHETGHAVAAVMRGATVESISFDPGRVVVIRSEEGSPFIAFAGSWAEARFMWPLPTLDGQDAQGRTFADYLADCVGRNVEDRAKFQDVPTDGFSEELERQWPVIQKTAQRLCRTHWANMLAERERRQRQLYRRSSRYRYETLKRTRLQREQKRLGLI